MNAGPVAVLPYLAVLVVTANSALEGTANSALGGKAPMALRFPDPGVAYYYRSFLWISSDDRLTSIVSQSPQAGSGRVSG
jgi:hypothetical protein